MKKKVLCTAMAVTMMLTTTAPPETCLPLAYISESADGKLRTPSLYRFSNTEKILSKLNILHS